MSAALPARKRRRSTKGALVEPSCPPDSSSRSVSTGVLLSDDGLDGRWRLLESDHHAVRPRQRCDVSPAETGLFHPLPTVGPRKVETAMRLDEHVQTHEQAKGIRSSLVVDQRFVHDQGALGGKGLIRFM